jgi:hypothetical protein
MIDREPPTDGAQGVRKRFSATSGLVSALEALPRAPERRMVGLQESLHGNVGERLTTFSHQLEAA